MAFKSTKSELAELKRDVEDYRLINPVESPLSRLSRNIAPYVTLTATIFMVVAGFGISQFIDEVKEQAMEIKQMREIAMLETRKSEAEKIQLRSDLGIHNGRLLALESDRERIFMELKKISDYVIRQEALQELSKGRRG